MPTLNREKAKEVLDRLIKKSRIHFYKPIQIAEILYRNRVVNDIKLLNLDDYRTQSKKWRDDICKELLGRVCTSSAKFQDNLFENNAIPPIILNELGKENRRTEGAVEAYIYNSFTNRYKQLAGALDYIQSATKDTFHVKDFLASFWNEPGLKRSLDKVYEIVVFALFSTIVDALDPKVEVSVNREFCPLLKEFEDFSRKLMCIDASKPKFVQNAAMYRAGVTNAADRGLDMYSNWGSAIQIKHLTLDIERVQNIVEGISSDRIVIVCKDAEKDVIVSLLTQIGWTRRIQSVITEKELIQWYEKALRGKYSNTLGDELLAKLAEEIGEEFPSVVKLPEELKKRHYETIQDIFWS